jgi:hypothetical protein
MTFPLKYGMWGLQKINITNLIHYFILNYNFKFYEIFSLKTKDLFWGGGSQQYSVLGVFFLIL